MEFCIQIYGKNNIIKQKLKTKKGLKIKKKKKTVLVTKKYLVVLSFFLNP